MFGNPSRVSVRDLTADDVARGMADGGIMLVDVREPREIELERIAGSVFMPMSMFDPQQIPDPEGRTVVFLCAAGIRSIKASELAQAAGLAYDAHLAGGLKAWKAEGLPVEQ